MPDTISKSEFLKRLADAAMNYRCNFAAVRLTASSNDMIDLAVKAAEDCKLPAVATDSDPITNAVTEIGARGELSHINTMFFVERAWEYLLSDEKAHTAFKQLNP